MDFALLTFEGARRKGEKEGDPGIVSSEVAQRAGEQAGNRIISLESVRER